MVSPRRSTTMLAFAGVFFTFSLVMQVWVAARPPAQDTSGTEVNERRRQRFTPRGEADEEAAADQMLLETGRSSGRATEAPAAFDNLTNGFTEQGPDYDTLDEDSVVALRSFNDNRFIFEETETAADGLGPTYNAQSCRECHQNIVTGGASQVAEHRTGRIVNGQFFESLGGSLIQSRATHPDMNERVTFQDDIRTFRISTNTLGAGFVEAVSNATLLAIRDKQPAGMRGTALVVPILEAPGRTRIGRFGWKCQHASLESFSADAYLNEMGITSPLIPDENSSGGHDVSAYDLVDDPEDDGVDLRAFADFMRSTKAPPPAPSSRSADAGERVFNQLGCNVCHVATLRTAPVNTVINGGALVVPEALGDKLIHPYSDFLLHDIGSGDGIPFLPDADHTSTATQIRTAPLWGLRTRNRLMHDGLSFTREDAIRRHGGQASGVRSLFEALPANQRQQLMDFLDSL